jgi:ABC-type multidrug transport system fused ATPase/permease subunit
MKKEKKILDKLRLFDKKLKYNKKLIKELEEEESDSVEYLNKHFNIALIEVMIATFVSFYLLFNIEVNFDNMFIVTWVIFLPIIKNIIPLYIFEVKSLKDYNNKLFESLKELVIDPDWRNTLTFFVCMVMAFLCSFLFVLVPFLSMFVILTIGMFFIDYSNEFNFICAISFCLILIVIISTVIIKEMFKERIITAKKENYIKSKKKLKEERTKELKEKTLIYEEQIMKTIKNDFDTIDGLELIEAYIQKYEFKELKKIIKEQKKDYYLEKTKGSYKEAIEEDLEKMNVITND